MTCIKTRKHLRKHKSYLIRQAIEQNRRGYTPETDEAVTKFWNEYWEFCTKQYPELEMRQPGNKPAGSDWPTFRPIKLIRHHMFGDVRRKRFMRWVCITIGWKL